VIMRTLLDRGVEIDLYGPAPTNELVALEDESKLRCLSRPLRWRWDRWYSRGLLRAFFTSSAMRILAYRGLVDDLLAEHERRPYDLVFQWSQLELFVPRRRLRRLPPIVVFPGTHAAGELRWHRRETHIARRTEGHLKHTLVRGFLVLRVAIQQLEARKPAVIVALSATHLEELRTDYGLEAQHMYVVRHPIEIDTFTPNPQEDLSRATDGVYRLLFVSRLSVRKGFEQVIGLSHRLADLAGQVAIDVIGGATLWSDYRPLVADLNPRLASHIGGLGQAELVERYRRAEAVIVPSLFEPGGLVLAEALACGLPVIASDAVGSAEEVDPACCRRYAAGNLDELEAAVRALLDETPAQRAQARQIARQEALRLFSPRHVGEELHRILLETAARRTPAATRS
jgi:glycosyltransferase involved in cell wall biosynthesis